jgi:hypothetical protein
MCSYYQNHPEAIPTWQQYIGSEPEALSTPFPSQLMEMVDAQAVRGRPSPKTKKGRAVH